MNRDTFVKKVDALVKLVRTEYGLTQEQMSQCLGISKKTLVGIEKGALGANPERKPQERGEMRRQQLISFCVLDICFV